MSEVQIEIQKQFRQQQEKLVYYIIALSVSAIGFSIYKTTGQSLKVVQIPIGLAVICWSISIYCGLKFLKYVISNLYANNEYFEIKRGNNSDVGNHPDAIEAGIKGYKAAMVINQNRMKRFFKYQSLLFYIGIILFIIWHLLEMYSLNQ
jgi:uncharacterized membrane protein YtjA (UPF0391 family)